MNQRIIFLDIDGPVIPDSLYFLDDNVSELRSYMDSNALGYVAALAKGADAKIVTNSQHNLHMVEEIVSGKFFNLKEDLIRHGLPEQYFHEDWRTEYSNLPWAQRRLSLETWLIKHGYEIDSNDWICFDDFDFTQRKNLILIDAHCGITYKDYIKACKFWSTPELI